MKATYDPEANAAYVEIVPGFSREQSYGTEELAPGILVDYAPSGAAGGDGWVPVGLEILNAKPRPPLAKVAAEHGFAHLLDDIYAVLDTVTGFSASGSGRITSCQVSIP